MRQYLDAKQQHRDAILFFRMGDFYEMFYEDALVAARALELTLTSRSKDANGGGIPMCGVPFHAVDTYIARLVRKGFRVAICDQVEDPRKAKGLVKREVVRVVSPGTLSFGSATVSTNAATVTLAQGWLDNLGSFTDNYSITLLHNEDHQDFITGTPPKGCCRQETPEPASTALVAAGLLAMIATRRRIRKDQSARDA